MKRVFSTLVFLATVFSGVPYVHAQDVAPVVTNHEVCQLDGSISTAITSTEVLDVTEVDQPVTLTFAVQNNSSEYTYGGISVGVGVYANAATDVPEYWAPVSDDIVLLPQQRQLFEVELDSEFVAAGQYNVRAAASQGGQIATIAISQNVPGQTFTKTAPGATFPFTLQQSPESVQSVGGSAGYTLTTENTTSGVLRDYEQFIIVNRGEAPQGSAIVSQTVQSVKLIPNMAQTLSHTSVLAVPGDYSVNGFSLKQNTLLPFAYDSFKVGEEAGPDVVFIPAVGLSGINHTDDTLTMTSCVVSGTSSSTDVHELEYVLVFDETSTETVAAQVPVGGGLSVSYPKTDFTTVELLANLYQALPADEEEGEAAYSRGSLMQSVTQTIACDEDCSPRSVTETLESFAAEETVQSVFWFYLGIVLAAALLLLIMLGRLTPSEEEEHIEMHEPQ